MKIIIKNNYEEVSKKAYQIIKEQILKNPSSVLGFATGSSPLGIYKNLIQGYKENKFSFKDITSLNLDEYIGLPEGHHQSYRYFMDKNLFDHLDIDAKNINFPDVNAGDIKKECERYSNFITDNVPDLQLLGIGNNGHIGFNEPGTPFNTKTHIVELKESTRQANARFFPSLSDVPTHALTMGISDILQAKSILLIATGTSKQEAVAAMIEGEISESCPASALRLHPNVTVIIDQESASLLKKQP